MRFFGGLVVIVIAMVVGAYAYIQSQIPAYREAVVYAFGPYEFNRSIQELSLQKQSDQGMFTAQRIRAGNPDWDGMPIINTHIHNGDLIDHTSRAVTTPNNDTLYSSAVLELSRTPVEVTIPAVGDRYLSIALMDMFSDQFAHIGPRETGGAAGTYWILGPDESMQVPEGVTEIRATSNDVWLLARTFVSGVGDLDAARTIQARISVSPVRDDVEPRLFETAITDIANAENFITATNEILARTPNHPHALRAKVHTDLGIGGEWDALGPIKKQIWNVVSARAKTSLRDQIEIAMDANAGWSTPPTNLGNYGQDDLTRAAISLIGFGALRREDAIYYRMTRTEDGSTLEGSQRYQMKLPSSGVPAEAFWSLALYEPDGSGRFFFYENPMGRYSINSASEDLVLQPDGSIVIEIGPDAPESAGHVWMPTPDGPFAAFFRVYMPGDEVLTGEWSPPAIEQVE